MSTRVLGGLSALALVLIIAGASILSETDDAGAREATDGAFVSQMVPHHESAIEMAKIALEKAEHPEIKALARSIVASQGEEISTLESIHQRMFGQPVGSVDHGSLGLPEHAMGMDTGPAALERAEPFDKAFIDMMIPHHQGAIQMARVELERGSDAKAQDLAEQIIVAQAREIEDMNQWRADWYGEASPSGGVPPAEEGSAPSHEAMGH